MTENISSNFEICPISGETRKEERLNYLTHLIGLFLSLIGGVVLFWVSCSSDMWAIISCLAYSTSLIGLYTASTFYHRCTLVVRKRIWKIADHSCIYLLIAGSVTPFALGPLRPIHGWLLFSVIWGIAAIGIVFKLVAIERFKRLSLCSYLVMGWLILFSFPTLMEELSPTTLYWLITGGLSYTFGTIFYAWKGLPFGHAIWHFFVLGGSFCHYCSILNVIQNR